jgi:hypothetical protein
MTVRARLAALAAVVGSFLAALPAQAQTAPAADATMSGTDNGGLIWVWVWILVAGVIIIGRRTALLTG